MTEPGGLRSALRHRDYRLLIEAFALSAAGSWAYNVALAVYIYEQTGSPAWVGAATIARFVPSLLLSSYGGVVAERFERVRLMIALDLVSTVWMLLLALVALFEGPVLLAIVLAALTSIIGTAYEPAVAAITPQLVTEDDLAAANTLRNTVDNVAVVAGPALGALLLLVGPPAVAFAVNAASYGASALIVARIRARSRPVDVTEGGEAGPLAQMLVGVRAIASSSTATLLVWYSVLASFVYGVDTVQFVVLSEQRLGTGPTGYGYLLAGLGVGGVLAAGLVNRLAATRRLGVVLLAGMAVYCLPTAAFLIVDEPVVAFVLQAIRGAGTLVVDVLAVTALQRSLNPDLIARVFGVYFAFVLGAISLGALVTPAVLRWLGLDASLVLAGVAIPVASLLGWPWLRRMDQANLVRLATLEPRVALLERTGMLATASRGPLERLATSAVEVELPQQQVVVREGEKADAFYVIAEGEVAVTARGEATEERQLPSLTAGDYFGEIGLLERIPRTATVITKTPTRLLRIAGQDFLDAFTDAQAAPTLLEGAKTRLARTHPSYRPEPPAAAA